MSMKDLPGLEPMSVTKLSYSNWTTDRALNPEILLCVNVNSIPLINYSRYSLTVIRILFNYRIVRISQVLKTLNLRLWEIWISVESQTLRVVLCVLIFVFIFKNKETSGIFSHKILKIMVNHGNIQYKLNKLTFIQFVTRTFDMA